MTARAGDDFAPRDLAALLRAKQERDTAQARARDRFAQTLARFGEKYSQAAMGRALGIARQEVHRLIRDHGHSEGEEGERGEP